MGSAGMFRLAGRKNIDHQEKRTEDQEKKGGKNPPQQSSSTRKNFLAEKG
jgi:hypothetical protein